MASSTEDSDNDYAGEALAAARRREADSLFRRTGGQAGGHEPTPSEVAAEEREAIARQLRVWEKPGPTGDGRTVVHEAFSEHATDAQLRELAELCAAPFKRDSINADHGEIGRIAFQIISSYAKACAEANGDL